GGERSTSPTEGPGAAVPTPGIAPAAAAFASAGGRRIRNATGIISTAARAAISSIDVRQPVRSTSQAANGDMVIGAMPMPADTSDTARLRWVSNQPVTVAMIGAKIAAIAPPTQSPNTSWNASSDVVRLASARLAARMIAPVSTTGRGPK